jgi:hypothetical protein
MINGAGLKHFKARIEHPNTASLWHDFSFKKGLRMGALHVDYVGDREIMRTQPVTDECRIIEDKIYSSWAQKHGMVNPRFSPPGYTISHTVKIEFRYLLLIG